MHENKSEGEKFPDKLFNCALAAIGETAQSLAADIKCGKLEEVKTSYLSLQNILTAEIGIRLGAARAKYSGGGKEVKAELAGEVLVEVLMVLRESMPEVVRKFYTASCEWTEGITEANVMILERIGELSRRQAVN